MIVAFHCQRKRIAILWFRELRLWLMVGDSGAGDPVALHPWVAKCFIKRGRWDRAAIPFPSFAPIGGGL